MNKQIQIIALAVAALVLTGGGFVAGMTVGSTAKAESAAAADASGAPGNAARRQAAQGGPGGAGFGGGQGQQVAGRVLSVGDGSITVEVRQPGSDAPRSTIALVGPSARVVRTTETEIKLSDIKAGDQVIVLGTPDAASGTVSASAVVVGLNVFQQLFGGGARPSGSSGGQRPTPSPFTRP